MTGVGRLPLFRKILFRIGLQDRFCPDTCRSHRDCIRTRAQPRTVKFGQKVAVPINENGDPEAAVMTAKETVTSLSCVWIFQPVLEYPFNYSLQGKLPMQRKGLLIETSTTA